MTLRKKPQLDCHTCPGRMNSIFCDLEQAALAELNQSKNANTYKKGQNLFIEGNPPFGLFCVHSGRVKIYKTNADGSETIVRLLGSGDVAGHRSLFSNSPLRASATVIEEAHVCFVSRDTVHSLVQKDPHLCCEIVNRIGREMGAAEEKLASMARKSVRERFAETLLLLKESFGVATDEGIKLEIRLTREEVAQIVGAASENIIRLVSEFKEQGYISQDQRYLILLDVPAIEKEASL